MTKNQLPNKPAYPAGVPYPRPLVSQGYSHQLSNHPGYNNATGYAYEADYQYPQMIHSSHAVGDGMYSEYMNGGAGDMNGQMVNSAIFGPDNHANYNNQVHGMYSGMQIRSLHDIYPQRRMQPYGYGSSKFQPVYPNASPVATASSPMMPQTVPEAQSAYQGKRNLNYALNPFVPNEEDTDEDQKLERVTEF